MRDSKGDREIPEEVKNDFEDQEPFLKEKLKTLKDMIVDRFPVSNARYKNIWKYWLRNWLISRHTYFFQKQPPEVFCNKRRS